MLYNYASIFITVYTQYIVYTVLYHTVVHVPRFDFCTDISLVGKS